MIVLITATLLGQSEAMAGLMALGSLAPYFTVIFFINKKLKKTFSFSIKKVLTEQLIRNTELNF